jgi:hypothetical protein
MGYKALLLALNKDCLITHKGGPLPKRAFWFNPGYATYLAKNRTRPIPFLAIKGFMRIILEGYGK